MLPRDAVNDSPGGSFVFVVKDGKAIQTPVEVLNDDGANVAVSGKGLAPGDVVVEEGQLRVTPGGAVRVLGKPQGVSGPGTGARGRKKHS